MTKKQTPSQRNEKKVVSEAKKPPSTEVTSPAEGRDWIDAELEDAFDEELELEIDDHRAPFDVKDLVAKRKKSEINRKIYFRELFRLQTELIKLQDWVQHTGYRLVVVFEDVTRPARAALSSASRSGSTHVCAGLLRCRRRRIARRTSGTSSATFRICLQLAKSCCSTAPGTTALALSG